MECGLKADVEGFSDGQLKETVEEMAALLNDPENPPTQSMLHAVQRHRDVLEDYKVDFKRTKVCACLLCIGYRALHSIQVSDTLFTRVTCNTH